MKADDILEKLNKTLENYCVAYSEEYMQNSLEDFDIYVSDDEEGACSIRFFDGNETFSRKFELVDVFVTNALNYIEKDNIESYVRQMESVLIELKSKTGL